MRRGRWGFPRVRASGLLLAALALVVLARPFALHAQVPAVPADSAQTLTAGSGDSYWGPIPHGTDSTTATLTNRPMPVWEGIIYWPYRVITYPIKLVGMGIGASIAYVDEHRVLAFLFRPPGVLRIEPDITAGGLSGFGGGLAVRHTAFLGEGNELKARVFATVNGDQKVTLGLRFPIAAVGELQLGAGFRDRANARYFGIGPETHFFDLSYYRQRMWWAGGSYAHTLTGDLYGVGGVIFNGVGAAEPDDDFHPWITERYGDDLPFGFGFRSEGFTAGLGLIHEDAPVDGRPTRGGVRRAIVTYFHSTSQDDTRYWQYRGELQQFIPLWFPYHTLALRGFVSWMDPVGDREIPFQRLMFNDDPDLLRGFNDYRWRDRGLAVLSAEYRFPLWAYQYPHGSGMDLYFLADVGQVFAEFNQITADNLTFSYGIGVRLLSSRGFILRLEWSRSNEGSVFRLRTDQIFQYTRALFSGRDPIPAR